MVAQGMRKLPGSLLVRLLRSSLNPLFAPSRSEPLLLGVGATLPKSRDGAELLARKAHCQLGGPAEKSNAYASPEGRVYSARIVARE